MISSPYHYPETDLSFYDTFSLPIGLYISWQIGYWVVTEILLRWGYLESFDLTITHLQLFWQLSKQIIFFLRRQLAADKDLVTSVRWLSMDKKNGFRNLSVNLLKSVGLMKPGEDLDPESVKTKIVFAVCQLVKLKILKCTFQQILNEVLPFRFILCLLFFPHLSFTAATGWAVHI